MAEPNLKREFSGAAADRLTFSNARKGCVRHRPLEGFAGVPFGAGRLSAFVTDGCAEDFLISFAGECCMRVEISWAGFALILYSYLDCYSIAE
ncbi:hypothetical protein [Methylobacterium haplocladii]|uniref:hypothetical protein n=1 Tax=Methylobacterium haplocladii TaxID=1176176 RepID=UPI0011BE0598|nr:hypothetical protein [Methylobacterium haplocladii]